VLTSLTTQTVTDPIATAKALVEASKKYHKPILAAWMGEHDVWEAREIMESGKIPNYRYPESAVDVFTQMHQYSLNLNFYMRPRLRPLTDLCLREMKHGIF
jgi:acetyltransferase